METIIGDGFVILTPRKPLYGSPCNGCGSCCQRSICLLGQGIFPNIPHRSAACPALEWDGEKYRCGVLSSESDPIRREFIQLTLGHGFGCCSSITEEDYAAESVVEARFRRVRSRIDFRLRELSNIIMERSHGE